MDRLLVGPVGASTLEHPTDRMAQRVYYLASGLFFSAAFLRSLLLYQDDPILAWVLALLLAGLVLFVSEPVISRKLPGYLPALFSIYLVFQTGLVSALLLMPGSPDFFASLLPILSMQVMLRFSPKIGWLCIGGWSLLTGVLLVSSYEIGDVIALTLVFTAINLFFGSYTLTIRNAQAARHGNQSLAGELQAGNRQLQVYSTQLEQLAAARERYRLARELHDSVTQTVFSMTLTTRSALLLLERDPGRVGDQLDRLNALTHSALSEIQALISELKPGEAGREGLVSALRRHLASSRFPEDLSVSLEVEGDLLLEPAEEQSLLRIAQEALNNIVKHAQARQAWIRLHLAEPVWMEITDQGRGFDMRQAEKSGGVGLASMRERASEIGWDLQIISASGAGTCILVEKAPVKERQA